MKVIVIIVLLLIFLFGSMAFVGAPYVPSKSGDVKRAFKKLYPLGEDDLLVDLGSGDGVVLKLAAQAGARAIGFELNPLMVWLSRLRLRRYPDTQVICANYYNVELPKSTTVVYTFGDTRDIAKLYRKIQAEATRLHKPLYFISYAFAIKGIKPNKKSGAYFLYRVEPKTTK